MKRVEEMAKRKTKKASGGRRACFLMFLSVCILLGVMFVQGTRLQARAESYEAREAALEADIEAEKDRTQDMEEQRKYMQTKKYVEEVAREKLGLVYPNETIYKADK